jgi:type I restriction enzyme, S subunit
MNTYPSYKESGVEWIGEIPSEWKTKRLKYVFNIYKGTKPTSLFDDYQEDRLPYLSMNVLRSDKPENFCNKLEGVRVSKNDLLILWDGSNSGEIVKSIDGILSSTMSNLKTKTDDNIKFLYFLLKCYEQDFKLNTIGMGIPHVDGNHLRNSILTLPPFQEQQQISKYLNYKTSKIDTLIEKTEQKIELLKEQQTSLINTIVTKGLNPNVEMKDSGVEWIGEIPSGWEVKKLNHICSKVRNGYVGPTRGIMRDSGVKYIQGIHIKKGGVEFTPDGHYYVSEEWSQSHSESILQEGDVLVVQTGSIGNVGYLQKELENSNCHALIIVRIKKSEGVGRFLHYYFLSNYVQNFLQIIKTGEILYHINTKKLRPLSTLVPPLPEQQQIVHYLNKETSKIDTLITKESKRIELLKEYRQSLISDVVTGKVDVRNEVLM